MINNNLKFCVCGTLEQLQLIVNRLLDLEYVRGFYCNLYPSDTGASRYLKVSSGIFTDYTIERHGNPDTEMIVSAGNTELIDALLSLQEEGDFVPGEVLVVTGGGMYAQPESIGIVLPNKDQDLMAIRWLKEVHDSEVTYRGNGTIHQQEGGYFPSEFRRATPEEIFELFTQNKITIMEPEVQTQPSESYRFKTAEEFEEQYGRNWRYDIPQTWPEPMDHLLGQSITKEEYEHISSNNVVHLRGYSISSEMVTVSSSAPIAFLILKDYPGGIKGNNLTIGVHITVEEGLKYPELLQPVYPVKVTSKELEIGTPSKKIVVRSNGRILVPGHFSTDIKKLEALRTIFQKDFNADPNIDFSGGHNINVESVWIGCRSKGLAITVADYANIIEAHRSLQ